MQSTLFTELTAGEEANLSGGGKIKKVVDAGSSAYVSSGEAQWVEGSWVKASQEQYSEAGANNYFHSFTKKG